MFGFQVHASIVALGLTAAAAKDALPILAPAARPASVVTLPAIGWITPRANATLAALCRTTLAFLLFLLIAPLRADLIGPFCDRLVALRQRLAVLPFSRRFVATRSQAEQAESHREERVESGAECATS
jgi:hypothetical protein